MQIPETLRPLHPPFHREQGQCWQCELADLSSVADTLENPRRSPVGLYEDGVALSQPHSGHDAIRTVGEGRYSHWGGYLYFATSDNSDPNSNGRQYELRYRVPSPLLVPEVANDLVARLARTKEYAPEFLRHVAESALERTIDRQHYAPHALHDEKELLLAKLIDDHSLVQGASVRTLCIADLYLQKALQRFGGSLAGRTVVEIGPGRNLGGGLVFRYHGADGYYGVELFTDNSFNPVPVLRTLEVLIRLKYGTFLENFQQQTRRVVQGNWGGQADLADDHIHLVKPVDFATIPLPDGCADFVFSHFTFEHLQRVEDTVDEIARLLKSDGLTAHFIDIEDHADFSRPFEYLKHSTTEWDARFGDGRHPHHVYQNRYRASDYRRAFERAGLHVTNFEALRSVEVSEDVRRSFDPHFQAYDPQDIGIVWLMIEAVKTQ